jgi:hypothetical protein
MRSESYNPIVTITLATITLSNCKDSLGSVASVAKRFEEALEPNINNPL